MPEITVTISVDTNGFTEDAQKLKKVIESLAADDPANTGKVVLSEVFLGVIAGCRPAFARFAREAVVCWEKDMRDNLKKKLANGGEG